MTSLRKKSVADEPVTSVLPPSEVPVYTERELDADEEVLAALGYKPEFKREFSLWTSFCVSFAVLGLLPSFASTLYYGMGYAGTPGMVWGWLIAMAFIQCVAMSMAELCSSMPTSGGLYYASAVLAPPGWGPLAACEDDLEPQKEREKARLIPSCRVDWLVQLARSGHWCPIRRLCDVCYDPLCRIHRQSGLCATELSGLPSDHAHHAHPRLHQQHAD